MGIQGGNYRVAGTLLVNGVSTPWYDIKVDMNVYSMASIIEAHGPMYGIDGITNLALQPDYGVVTQQKIVPLAVLIGYEAASGMNSQVPIRMFPLEQGYLDEYTDNLLANEVEFIGRGTASIFQDNRISKSTTPQSTNLRGDQLATQLFAGRGIPLTVGAKSPTATIGKAYTEADYSRGMRGRSEWDELTDAALQDGFVIYVHNGRGYYGPAAQNVPTIQLKAGVDIVDITVNHAARRAHNIVVRVDSRHHPGEKPTTGKYPPTGTSGQTETFRAYVPGKNDAGCRAEARKIWLDLVKHEFIVKMKIIPDSDFLRLLANYGSNLLIQLDGMRPSANILYHVRQAVVTLEGGQDEPTLSVEITAANHVPLATGGSYQ